MRFHQFIHLHVELIGFGEVYARGSSRGVSVVFMRDIALHAKQRRDWNRGFNSSALKDYDQLLIKPTRELIQNLESRARLAETVDMSRWMKYFS